MSSQDTPIDPEDHVNHGFGLAEDDEPTPLQAGLDPLAAIFGEGAGGSGGLDFGALLSQASAMQAQLHAAQQEVAETVVEGVAGGGVVKVAVDGAFGFQAVTISPEAVDADDVEMLQDLVLAALRHAAEQIQDLQARSVDLAGLGLDGLGAMGGGAGPLGGLPGGLPGGQG